jgi:hypothetical protein
METKNKIMNNKITKIATSVAIAGALLLPGLSAVTADTQPDTDNSSVTNQN